LNTDKHISYLQKAEHNNSDQKVSNSLSNSNKNYIKSTNNRKMAASMDHEHDSNNKDNSDNDVEQISFIQKKLNDLKKEKEHLIAEKTNLKKEREHLFEKARAFLK
jgi:hypothetical protein